MFLGFSYVIPCWALSVRAHDSIDIGTTQPSRCDGYHKILSAIRNVWLLQHRHTNFIRVFGQSPGAKRRHEKMTRIRLRSAKITQKITWIVHSGCFSAAKTLYETEAQKRAGESVKVCLAHKLTSGGGRGRGARHRRPCPRNREDLRDDDLRERGSEEGREELADSHGSGDVGRATANVSREQRMRFRASDVVSVRATTTAGRGSRTKVAGGRSSRTLAHPSDPHSLDTCYLLWKWKLTKLWNTFGQSNVEDGYCFYFYFFFIISPWIGINCFLVSINACFNLGIIKLLIIINIFLIE